MKTLRTVSHALTVLSLVACFGSPLHAGKLQPGETRQLSVTADGLAGGDDWSSAVDVSDNGRLAVFASAADNLLPGGDNEFNHVYLCNLKKGLVRAVDQGRDGLANQSSYNPRISGKGRFVVFDSSATNLVRGAGQSSDHQLVYCRDLKTGKLKRVSVALGGELPNGTCFGLHSVDCQQSGSNPNRVYFVTLNRRLMTAECDEVNPVRIACQPTGRHQ